MVDLPFGLDEDQETEVKSSSNDLGQFHAALGLKQVAGIGTKGSGISSMNPACSMPLAAFRLQCFPHIALPFWHRWSRTFKLEASAAEEVQNLAWDASSSSLVGPSRGVFVPLNSMAWAFMVSGSGGWGGGF